MNLPARIFLCLLGTGLVGAGVLLWRPQHDAPAVAPARAGKPVVVESAERPDALAAPDPAALSPEARALLDSLQQLLATRDRRAREGVLTFKDDEALRRFRERAAKAGLTVLGEIGALRTVRVRYDDLNAFGRDLVENAADYDELAGNSLMRLPPGPTPEERAAVNLVPFGNRTLEFLGAAGDRSRWGLGLTIAVLDTGVAADPTFGEGRLRALDIGLGTAPGTGSGDGHGTSVAALAAGAARDAAGIAPGASLLSIRVTDTSGVSDIFTVAQAIVAATDAGARIINVSLGGYATNGTLEAALGYATERGSLVVAAAGNDQAAQLAWPAADTRVVSVGAVDAAAQQVTFSNSGPQLQLTAPGYGVQTAWLNGQRVLVDGTSASSPLVAGAIAAVMSQYPSLTPQQAADWLEQTASDSGAPGADADYGKGILNLGWAMNRNNPSYVDTAIASHHYNETTHEMEILVQNRSGRTVTGMFLNVAANNAGDNYSVPGLAPGEIYVARVSADPARAGSGGITFTTQLINPVGLPDQVPGNNKRSSTLTVQPKD